jgi:hypothetical protein
VLQGKDVQHTQWRTPEHILRVIPQHTSWSVPLTKEILFMFISEFANTKATQID